MDCAVASTPRRWPGILSATRSQHGGGTIGPPGLLEQAQSLREVLVSAIEQLKPPTGAIGASAPEALQYYILHEEYVLSKSTSYIVTRYSISESTFFRNRRAAVSAVARHLETQEEIIALRQNVRRRASHRRKARCSWDDDTTDGAVLTRGVVQPIVK